MARLVVFVLAALALWMYRTNAFSVVSSNGECLPCNSFKSLLVGIIIGVIGSWLYGLKEYFNELPKTKEIVSVTESKHLISSRQTSEMNKKYASRDNLSSISSKDFVKHMRSLTELIVSYVQNPDRPVLINNDFGFIFNEFPKQLPVMPQSFESLMVDIKEKLMPGLLHWQHPKFHGYFGGGISYPDILADTLATGLGANPFSWIGSPAFVELEMITVNWFAKAIGLPKEMYFDEEDPKNSTGLGIISYSSSEVIFNAVLTSRNRKLRELVKFDDPERQTKEAELLPKLIAYTNIESHSAIEKACKMALITLRTVKPNTPDLGLTGNRLEKAIKRDIANGLIPFHVHGSLGTTNTGAMDRLDELSEVAHKYKCWIHVDGAFGGAAMLCPEYRTLSKGIELLDSINVNLHKWPWCTTPLTFFFCRHRLDVQDAFAVYPVYLVAANHEFPAVRHWGVQLSRRALCLKAWFIMRCFGLERMQQQVRQLVSNAATFRRLIEKDNRFVIVGKPVLTLVTFRVNAETMSDSNKMTNDLCEHINQSSKLFVTHARPMGVDVVRVNMSHTLSQEDDAVDSYNVLSDLTNEFLDKSSQFSALRYQHDAVTDITASSTPIIDTTLVKLPSKADSFMQSLCADSRLSSKRHFG